MMPRSDARTRLYENRRCVVAGRRARDAVRMSIDLPLPRPLALDGDLRQPTGGARRQRPVVLALGAPAYDLRSSPPAHRSFTLRSAFSPRAVVATVAPRCLASWMAVDPTPPEPAWTRTGECLHDRSPRRVLASLAHVEKGRQRVGGGADDVPRPIRRRGVRRAGAFIGTRGPARRSPRGTGTRPRARRRDR